MILLFSNYFVIKNVESASDINPSQLTIEISDYTPEVRDEVTVTLKEVPYNKKAEYKDINGFYVDVYYGTKSEKEDNYLWQTKYILEGKFYRPANENDMDANEYWVTFSFVPLKAGTITIEYISHRHYDVNEKYIEINCISTNADTTNSNDIGYTDVMFFLMLFSCIIALIIKKRREN